MPSKEPRSKNICLVSYQNADYIKTVLQKHSLDIKDYAFILHDKDIDKNGNLKRPHYHIIIHLFGSGKSAATVRRWFYETVPRQYIENENTLAQICINLDSMKDYLTHCDSPDKFQYNKYDIITNNPDFLNSSTENQGDNKALEILDDLLEKNVCYYDLVKRHGREIIINFGHYKAYANLCKYGVYSSDENYCREYIINHERKKL